MGESHSGEWVQSCEAWGSSPGSHLSWCSKQGASAVGRQLAVLCRLPEGAGPGGLPFAGHRSGDSTQPCPRSASHPRRSALGGEAPDALRVYHRSPRRPVGKLLKGSPPPRPRSSSLLMWETTEAVLCSFGESLVFPCETERRHPLEGFHLLKITCEFHLFYLLL